MKTAKRHTFENNMLLPLLTLEFLAENPNTAQITDVTVDDDKYIIELYATNRAHEALIIYLNSNIE